MPLFVSLVPRHVFKQEKLVCYTDYSKLVLPPERPFCASASCYTFACAFDTFACTYVASQHSYNNAFHLERVLNSPNIILELSPARENGSGYETSYLFVLPN